MYKSTNLFLVFLWPPLKELSKQWYFKSTWRCARPIKKYQIWYFLGVINESMAVIFTLLTCDMRDRWVWGLTSIISFVVLLLEWLKKISNKGDQFFPEISKTYVLNQPSVDTGGVSMGRFVAEGCGCWLLAVFTSMALQRLFHGTFMSLPWHFYGTSRALQQKRRKKCIGTSIP